VEVDNGVSNVSIIIGSVARFSQDFMTHCCGKELEGDRREIMCERRFLPI